MLESGFWQATGLHDCTAKSAEEVAATARAQKTCGVIAPRGPKPPPAEARHKGVHSAGFVPQDFLALSFEERAKEDREAKIIGKPPHTSLNDHERLHCFARSFRALGVRQLLHPIFSHRGITQAEGLHDCTAKSAEEVAATARAPGADVQTTAAGEGRGRLRALPSRHSRNGTNVT